MPSSTRCIHFPKEINMIDYIGMARIRELLEQRGTARVLAELSQEIENDYRRWSEFDKSPRHAIHSRDGVIELMPTSDGVQYGFKYVNGHPKNTAERLLTVTAFGVLADVATGYPLLVSELTISTALRTAATSVMAARHLARRNSRVMAVIGNGAQSEFQILAFHAVMGIDTLRLFDVDPQATQKLVRNLDIMGLSHLSVTICNSTAEAVQGADIVTTITADKRNATIIEPDMVAPGMHLNAVGGDCPGKTELHADILRRPDVRVVVEYTPQTRIEGEIQQLDADFPVIEFADIAAGEGQGRLSDDDITIFDSVGFALEDFSTLRYLARLNQEVAGHRETIDLIPQPTDPKDLFGELRPRRQERRLRAV
jgi:ornithine cyclodeaminase